MTRIPGSDIPLSISVAGLFAILGTIEEPDRAQQPGRPSTSRSMPPRTRLLSRERQGLDDPGGIGTRIEWDRAKRLLSAAR